MKLIKSINTKRRFDTTMTTKFEELDKLFKMYFAFRKYLELCDGEGDEEIFSILEKELGKLTEQIRDLHSRFN